MIVAPENKAFPTTHPPMADLPELRRQEKGLQVEIESTWQEILTLEERTKRLGGRGFGPEWRNARQELATAEHKLSRLTSALDDHRTVVARAEREAAEEQTRRAEHEAAILEPEIIRELLILAGQMAEFSIQCQKIEALRNRARQLGERLLTRSVREAVYSNDGEINPWRVEARLRQIEKVAALPENVIASKVTLVMGIKDEKRQRQQEELRCAAAVRSFDNPFAQICGPDSTPHFR